jgi:hypothetical protein
MRHSYFRVQQALAKMVETTLDSEVSIEEAHEISHRLGELMIEAESPLMKDLYEMAILFGRWLDDTDIRQKDLMYNKLLSGQLRSWVLDNIHNEQKT